MQINNLSHLSSTMQAVPLLSQTGHHAVRDPPAQDVKPVSATVLAHDVQKMSEAMEMAKERLKDTGLNIRLSSGDGKDRFQIEVFNPETNEVIRRFPPDEIIKLAASIREMNGFVVDKAL